VRFLQVTISGADHVAERIIDIRACGRRRR
jgi:hypothetical protein